LRVALGTRLQTGDACVQTGRWRALHPSAAVVRLTRGDRMPACDGRVVVWELIQDD